MEVHFGAVGWGRLNSYEISIDKFVDIDRQEHIIRAMSILGSERLAPIKEKLGDDYSYGEIRLVMAHKMRYRNKRENSISFPVNEETCSDKPKAYSVKEIRKIHHRAYEPWTKEEDERLIAEYRSGKSIEELMELFGRQRGGIKSRIIFLALQSQCSHTDDAISDRISEACDREIAPVNRDKHVRIIAALTNPERHDYGLESVTLLNTTSRSIDLTGWALADKNRKKAYLMGSIEAGETLKFTPSGKYVWLSNKGGIITLFDQNGLKVDGVSYTREEASRSGWTIVF